MLITRTELPKEPLKVRLVSSTSAEEGRDYAIYLNDHLYGIGDLGLEDVLEELGVAYVPEITQRSTFPEHFEDMLNAATITINCLAQGEAAFLTLDGYPYTRRQTKRIYDALKAHF